MRRTCLVVVLVMLAAGCVDTELTDSELGTVEAELDAVDGNPPIGYSAAATTSATRNTYDQWLYLGAGTTLQVGTCGLVGASAQGDTYLRLDKYDGGAYTRIAYNDDNCSSLGSRIVFTAGTTDWYLLHAGCYGEQACSGALVIDTRLDANGRLADVVAAFNAIPDFAGGGTSVRMAFARGVLKGFTIEGSTVDHFQGVQRLRGGNAGYFIFTGDSHASDNVDENISVVYLGSRNASAIRLGSNATSAGPVDAANDRAVARMSLDWDHHAGGPQVSGNYLAVGVEPDGSNSGQSAIRVLDISSPLSMRVLYSIGRRTSGGGCASSDNPCVAPATGTGLPDTGTAGAVGLTKRLDGTYLLAVGEYDSSKVVFYKKTWNAGEVGWPVASSRFTDLASIGGWSFVAEWAPPGGYADYTTIGTDKNWGKYQNLNLITQQDGQVFVMGFHRDGSADWTDLFQVAQSGEALPGTLGTCTRPICITKVGKKHMYDRTGASWARFDAATGAYLLPDTNQIVVYGSDVNIGTKGYEKFLEF